MVAHCSDFFQVCASSSFLVLTASSNKLMLSWKSQVGNEHWGPLSQHPWGALVYPSAPQHADRSQHPKSSFPLLPAGIPYPCRTASCHCGPAPTSRGAIPQCWSTPASHPCSHPDLQLPTVILPASHMRSLWPAGPSWISLGSSSGAGAAAGPPVPGQGQQSCTARTSLALTPGGSDLLIVPTKFLILR